MDAITFPPAPTNEPNLTYAPGSPEREALDELLDTVSGVRPRAPRGRRKSAASKKKATKG